MGVSVYVCICMVITIVKSQASTTWRGRNSSWESRHCGQKWEPKKTNVQTKHSHTVYMLMRPQVQLRLLLGCCATLCWPASFLSHQNSPKQNLAYTLVTSSETITKQVNKQNSNTIYNILIGMSGVGNVHGNFKGLSRRFWWVIRLGRHCCEGYNSAQTVAKPLISMVTFSWSYGSNYAWLHPWLWHLLTTLRSFFIECVLTWWFLSINNDFWENLLEKKKKVSPRSRWQLPLFLAFSSPRIFPLFC